MTKKQSENEFIDDSEITEKRIKVHKDRTKHLIDLLRFTNEIEFTIETGALHLIAEAIHELDFNDSVIMKISKDINEDYFKIHVKLKLE